MHKNIFLLCVVLIAGLAAVQAASARNLIVAVSPYYGSGEARKHSIQLLQQLTQLDQGSRVTMIDGYNLSIIGEFNIPDNPAYKNPKARLGVNRKAVTALKRFADQSLAPGREKPSIPIRRCAPAAAFALYCQ